MKFFTNRSVIQKTVIAILTILLLTFAIPKPVSAIDNILLSPIITLATSLLDGIQHLLEWAMLGETSGFMKELEDTGTYPEASAGGYSVGPYSEDEIAGTLWGIDKVNIPNIRYTPEEIFANRIPALDVNFINPSVKTGDDAWDAEHNIAMKLQPTIASWYVAIRTLALVALLSVLVYLGIRMLITSVAADKAKYKKMMMDWIVGICLLFALHYIMSFALTMSEVVTSMLGQDTTQSINVSFVNNGNTYSFGGNLMSYVRFMIQSTDEATGLGFFFLYLMLVIYSIRFTWVYLKRVVNMAFLTLIAPFVALTYPIDKVSDGSAQAFNMWIKEFSFNALLQPLHLLLYKVLLGSATALAAINPLYAVVCLGFILAAEKLLKQMFGFNKAGAGTVGSLAGAAGVSAAASQALMKFAKKPPLPGGKDGKIRTNDKYKREGKNPNAPKGMDTLANGGMTGFPPALAETGEGNNNNNNLPPEAPNSNPSDNQNGGEQPGTQTPPKQDTLDDLEQQRAALYNDGYTDNSEEVAAINQRIQDGDFAEPPTEPDTSGSPDPTMTGEALQNIGQEEPEGLFGKNGMAMNDLRRAGKWIGNRKDNVVAGAKALTKPETYKNAGKRIIKGVKGLPHNANVALGKGYEALKENAPGAIYKAARGTLKTATRVAAGAALGATAGVIAATNGNGEQAIAALAGGFGVGFASGDNVFEAAAGKVEETVGAKKYGSKQDYRNAMADKEFLKSQEFNDYYEKNFKGKKTKKEVRDAFRSYREAGITDNKTIKTALALEDKYKAANTYNGDNKKLRQDVQAIVQTKDAIDPKAFSDPRKRNNQIKELEKFFPSANAKANAAQLFQGYQDFHDLWNF